MVVCDAERPSAEPHMTALDDRLLGGFHGEAEGGSLK